MLRRVVEWLIHWLDPSRVIRRFAWRRKVRIALYHKISRARFAEHLRVLRACYNLISLDMLVEAIDRQDWSRIPDNALVITFDDGDREFYELKELLDRDEVPTTHYVVSELVGTRRHYWFQEIADEVQVEGLKRESQPERLRILAERRGFDVNREYADRQALSLEEMHELMRSGVVIGDHTATHPMLPTCDDATARREIVLSKTELERKVGVPVQHFSYPNGAYSARDEELVRLAGYRSARTVERGLNDVQTSPFRLKIVDVLEDRSPEEVGQIELRLLWYRLRESCRMPARRGIAKP